MLVICETCGIEFNKKDYEIRKTEARGGVHCCTRKCGSVYANSVRDKGKNTLIAYYINQCRKKTSDTNITYRYLESLFEEQNKECIYTGIPLKLRTIKDIIENHMYAASLDRIDSNKPYEIGNVQFVSLMANYAKNRYNEQYLIDFINYIKVN